MISEGITEGDACIIRIIILNVYAEYSVSPIPEYCKACPPTVIPKYCKLKSTFSLDVIIMKSK